MNPKLSPEAETWLYRLLVYGTEGMPHEEYVLIDTGENKGKPWHSELYRNRFVDIRARVDDSGGYSSTWYITEAGIDYLKRRNA